MIVNETIASDNMVSISLISQHQSDIKSNTNIQGRRSKYIEC